MQRVKEADSALYEYTVRSADCDPELNFRPHEYLSAAQEAADLHSRIHGIAGAQLKEKNIGWMISSIRLDFAELWIHPGEKLLCRTWCSGCKGIRFDRQYLFYKHTEQEDFLLGSMQAEWFLIDLLKRRPLRPAEVMNGELMACLNSAVSVYPHSPGKIPLSVNSREERLFSDQTVYYSHIDTNGHLNHIHYLSQALDTFHLLRRKTDTGLLLPRCERIVLNYITEVKPLETLRMYMDESIPPAVRENPSWKRQKDGGKAVGAEAYNLNTGELSFKAEFVFTESYDEKAKI